MVFGSSFFQYYELYYPALEKKIRGIRRVIINKIKTGKGRKIDGLAMIDN